MVLRNSLQRIQQGGERAPGHSPAAALTLDGGALKCVSVGSCHWVFHWLLSDGAQHLLMEAGDWGGGSGGWAGVAAGAGRHGRGHKHCSSWCGGWLRHKGQPATPRFAPFFPAVTVAGVHPQKLHQLLQIVCPTVDS